MKETILLYIDVFIQKITLGKVLQINSQKSIINTFADNYIPLRKMELWYI